MFRVALFLFLCASLPCCESKDTITTTQPLSINDSLLSKENKFELHFFTPGNSSKWYVGIRYASLPGNPVVWVANRNDPVNNASGVFLAINGLGNLALYANNKTTTPIWSTSISVEGSFDASTISAQLLDSGNLVLINKGDKENPLWQSFDYPTDTLLPGMKLGLNRRTGLKWSITSWKSENDPGTSDYLYGIDLAGAQQFFLYNGSSRVWRCNAWPWTNQPSKLSIYPNEYIYENNENQIYYKYFSIDPSKTLRLVLDKSGVLQLLAWDRNVRNRWDEFWAAPKYRCDPYAACGANSKCRPDNFGKFQCECLPGFEPKSESEWSQRNASSGCARKRVQRPTRCENGDRFVSLAHVNLPDTSTAVFWWAESVAECENKCARNCSCTAFMIYGNNEGKTGCFMWFGQLDDIVQFTGDGYALNVRVNVLAGNPSSPKSFLKKMKMFALVITSIVLSLLFCLGFLHCWLKRKRRTSYKERRHDQDLPIFDLSTIMAATDNFSPANRLGQGGFGFVHMGLLSDGQKIAVKRLSKSSGQGIDEFKNETMLIAKLQHRNLVKLLGCCIEGEEKMLVYEYMPNRGLDSFIFDQTRRSCLDWKARYDIITGIARGVLYLHQDSRLRIIHRDLKASNVLLDAEMNPKISDFGMARVFTGDQIQDKTNRVVGTYGYMSPEYAVFGKFSTKSDVFSFGVILLEIISGIRNNHCNQGDGSTNLIGHVWQLWKDDRALEVVDSLLESYVQTEALRCIQIGLLCVQEEVMDRPSMSVVVLMLSSEITLPSPRKPAYIFMSSFKDTDSQTAQQGLCSNNQTTITKVIGR